MNTLTIFRREYSLVANGALRECHNVVYILRCCHSRFLALLVKPQIRSAKMHQFIIRLINHSYPSRIVSFTDILSIL